MPQHLKQSELQDKRTNQHTGLEAVQVYSNLLNGIVVLVHQSTNLKRNLFKKRSIFHLPCDEYC